jgi:hypothetical protein
MKPRTSMNLPGEFSKKLRSCFPLVLLLLNFGFLEGCP